jgi:hypothetical protein
MTLDGHRLMAMSPPTAAERKAICERLETDYQDRFTAIGGAFSAWMGGTKLGVEALFGGRVGPMWTASVRYAKRLGYWIGPLQPVVSLEDAEARIRADIEEYLTSHPPRPDAVE